MHVLVVIIKTCTDNNFFYFEVEPYNLYVFLNIKIKKKINTHKIKKLSVKKIIYMLISLLALKMFFLCYEYYM